MRSYGQYCPIARASELLAERWSIIILRNIVMLGCRTFNEIADCAPGLSRGLLSKRLRDLEHAGVIKIRSKPGGPGSIYEPTEAGQQLTELLRALQHWGSKWADLTPEQAHPGVVLWMWATFFLHRDRHALAANARAGARAPAIAWRRWCRHARVLRLHPRMAVAGEARWVDAQDHRVGRDTLARDGWRWPAAATGIPIW